MAETNSLLKQSQIDRIAESYPHHIDIADLLGHIKSLQQQVNVLQSTITVLESDALVPSYEHRIDTLTEALWFYAQRVHYDITKDYEYVPVEKDGGERARQALQSDNMKQGNFTLEELSVIELLLSECTFGDSKLEAARMSTIAKISVVTSSYAYQPNVLLEALDQINALTYKNELPEGIRINQIGRICDKALRSAAKG